MIFLPDEPNNDIRAKYKTLCNRNNAFSIKIIKRCNKILGIKYGGVNLIPKGIESRS